MLIRLGNYFKVYVSTRKYNCYEVFCMLVTSTSAEFRHLFSENALVGMFLLLLMVGMLKMMLTAMKMMLTIYLNDEVCT